MGKLSKQSNIYFDADIHHALTVKAATAQQFTIRLAILVMFLIILI
jgi:hypothetical protein